MKKLILAFFLSLNTLFVLAQAEMSVYSATGRGGVATTFVTDYQAAGINPANLGFGRLNDNKHFTLGFLEMSGNVFHQGLSFRDFEKYGLNYRNVTLQEKVVAAQKFQNNTVSGNMDVMLLGLAFQSEKLGGFSFSIRESFRFYSKLDATAADVVFRGATASIFDSLELASGQVVPNDPANYPQYTTNDSIVAGLANRSFSVGQLMGPSKIKQHWYREYNLNYGRKVLDKSGMQLYAGVGIKYVVGYNYMDVTSDGQNIRGLTAFNPITDPEYVLGTTSPSSTSSTRYSSIGNGYGFDLGLTLSIKQKYKVGVSAVNLGSVTYNKNVYSLKDTVFNAADYSTAEGFRSIGTLLNWQGEQRLKVALPAMLRAGASVSLLNYKMELGIDAIIPLNDAAGNFNNAWVGVGGDYKVLKFLRLSSGFNLGGNTAGKLNIPLGIAFNLGNTFEIGVASRDIISYFSPTSNSYSFAMGLVRWRI
jgi:hypothetical protein